MCTLTLKSTSGAKLHLRIDWTDYSGGQPAGITGVTKILPPSLPCNPISVSAFFEEVTSQTGIGVQKQHLLYLGHDLPLEGNMKVVNLPRTSPSQPLILLSHEVDLSTSLPFRERKTHTYLFLVFFLRKRSFCMILQVFLTNIYMLIKMVFYIFL